MAEQDQLQGLVDKFSDLSTTGTPTQPQCGTSFLSLPGELRNVIYELYLAYDNADYVAASPESAEFEKTEGFGLALENRYNNFFFLPNCKLLATCHAIRNDILSSFWKDHVAKYAWEFHQDLTYADQDQIHYVLSKDLAQHTPLKLLQLVLRQNSNGERLLEQVCKDWAERKRPNSSRTDYFTWGKACGISYYFSSDIESDYLMLDGPLAQLDWTDA